MCVCVCVVELVMGYVVHHIWGDGVPHQCPRLMKNEVVLERIFFRGGQSVGRVSLFRTLTACHSCRAVPEVSLVVARGHPVLRGGGRYL